MQLNILQNTEQSSLTNEFALSVNSAKFEKFYSRMFWALKIKPWKDWEQNLGQQSWMPRMYGEFCLGSSRRRYWPLKYITARWNWCVMPGKTVNMEKASWYKIGRSAFREQAHSLMLGPCSTTAVIPCFVLFFHLFYSYIEYFSLKKWQLSRLCVFFWNTTYACSNVPCGQSSKHTTFHICFSSFLTISLPDFTKQLTPEEFLSTIYLFLGGVKISHEQAFRIFLCKMFFQLFNSVDKPTGKTKKIKIKREELGWKANSLVPL